MSIITSDILQRVFAISPDQNSMGSCFAIPDDGKYYFVTAAHVLGDIGHGEKTNVYLQRDGKWLETEVIPFYASGRPFQDGDVDIAILLSNISVGESSRSLLEMTAGGATLGQDTYFLGFPYFGRISYKPESINSNFPLPFVKKATLSAFHFQEGLIYIDGHNNPGFSGGPLVFWDNIQRKLKIAGVISSYVTHLGQVQAFPTSTNGLYLENSGIGVAYNIDHANKLYKLITSK